MLIIFSIADDVDFLFRPTMALFSLEIFPMGSYSFLWFGAIVERFRGIEINFSKYNVIIIY